MTNILGSDSLPVWKGRAMKIPVVIWASISAIFLCSCASPDVTRNLQQALAHVEEDIEYHDVKYMSRKKMYVPHGVDEKKLGTLKFNFAFEQGNTSERQNDSNLLSKNEWNAFKREFENAIAGTKRFPIGQMKYGLADKELRKEARNGLSGTKDLDVSEMTEVDGILHIVPMFTNSSSKKSLGFFSGGGFLTTTTRTIKIICNPLSAKNNEPIDHFQSFSVQIAGRTYARMTKMGIHLDGVCFDADPEILEDYHIRLSRAGIVQFFNRIYKIFPVGGAVVNFGEDDNAVLQASRSTGVQPDMEFVIYARKKGDPNSLRIPLFNATAVSVGQTGNTELKIWRKNTTKAAVKIISMISSDPESALAEYDFYGCSDGLAHWPDFIERTVEVDY